MFGQELRKCITLAHADKHLFAQLSGSRMASMDLDLSMPRDHVSMKRTSGACDAAATGSGSGLPRLAAAWTSISAMPRWLLSTGSQSDGGR